MVSEPTQPIKTRNRVATSVQSTRILIHPRVESSFAFPIERGTPGMRLAQAHDSLGETAQPQVLHQLRLRCRRHSSCTPVPLLPSERSTALVLSGFRWTSYMQATA